MCYQPGQRVLFEASLAGIVEEQRVCLRIKPNHPQEKREITDTRSDESFFGGGRRAGLVIPKADQQIRGEPDQLPANEQQQKIVRDHQSEHGRSKQRQKTEEPCEVLVVGHIPDAINKNQQTDERDHHEHRGCKRIEHPTEPQRSLAKLEPNEAVRLSK